MNDKVNKILVVCMLDSVHTARWLTMFRNEQIDFILFPSTPHRRIHPGIKKLVKDSQNSSATYSLKSTLDYFAIPIWVLGLFSNLWFPAFLLKKVAVKNQVSQIHAIELNHAGYIVSQAYKFGLPKNIRIISTNWGSDIYWFQQFPNHRKRLVEILKISNFYTAECVRDLKLASDLGFSGEFGEVLPNAGGFSRERIEHKYSVPSERNAIVVKGYESFVGRASIALAAIESIAELLVGYKIHIYSANRKTIKNAIKLVKRTGLEVFTYPKKSLSHDQVLDLFRNSRVYVGISLSDAISTSLLEAMVSGTYPIQTNTSCANEWIESGVTGSIVNPEVNEIAKELRIAVTNNELVNSAAVINSQTSMRRLNSSVIESKLKNFYKNS